MSYRQYEDPNEICCGQCGRWHSAPACDAWRWTPAPPVTPQPYVFYRLADGTPCISSGMVNFQGVYHPIDWEEIEF